MLEESRDVGFAVCVDALAQETRRAVRALSRAPGFTSLAVFTIVIGVAAATSMFGLLRSLVFAPPPQIAEPGRVYRLHQVFPREDGSEEVFAGVSYPFFELLQSDLTLIDAVGSYKHTEVSVGIGPAARLARARLVSAGFWRVMAARPALGRFIDDREAHPVTGERVVVLGYAFWRHDLGGKEDVLGTSLRIKGHPYTIVGVAPRGFRGVEFSDVDLWLPLFAEGDGSKGAVAWHIPKTSFDMTVAIRLRAAEDYSPVSAQLTNLYRSFLEEAYVLGNSSREVAIRDRNRRARTILGPVTGGLGEDLTLLPEARLAAWLVGIALVLLAIACSNLAGLLLLRAVARRHEIAVSLALGVSRRRLALQLFAESSILMLLGSVTAIAVIAWSSESMQHTILPHMAWEPANVTEWTVLGVALLCASLITFVAGMAPLWYASRYGVSTLRDIVMRAPGKRPPILRVLLVTQCALTVLLLIGAGLFLKSVQRARTENLGLDRDDTLVVQINFTGTGRTGASVTAFFDRALERARTIPGVVSASLATDGPLRSARMTGGLSIPGRDEFPSYSTGGPYVNAVTPGFFATAGMQMREGRDFVDSDRVDGAMVVNETLARAYWPNQSAVGQCLVPEPQKVCLPIVGVVADSRRFNLIENERYLYYYVPLSPNSVGSRALLVRKAVGARGVEASLRRVLIDLDPALPYVSMEALGAPIEPQMRRWRLGASVFSAFGLLAVILALIGLFAGVSYKAAQRTPELATRIALGATRLSVVGLMLRDGLREAATGVTAGLILALWIGPYLEPFLFRVSSTDFVVIVVVPIIVLALAACASFMPAWRVSGVDPAAALRSS